MHEQDYRVSELHPCQITAGQIRALTAGKSGEEAETMVRSVRQFADDFEVTVTREAVEACEGVVTVDNQYTTEPAEMTVADLRKLCNDCPHPHADVLLHHARNKTPTETVAVHAPLLAVMQKTIDKRRPKQKPPAKQTK